ncbi:MAG: thiamine phosphate synthase [bacterium]
MVPKENPLDFDIYPVTCQKLSRGRSNLEVLDALIEGGARIVQLREKELPDGEFFKLARLFRHRTAKIGMTLIINDRLDVCRAVEADGLHLGQDDFPLREARKLLGPQTIIGVSTHNVKEALRAVEDGADYINVGPVFQTQTKQHSGPPVGLRLFQEISSQVKIPITVMGGINLDNLDQVLQAGAKRVAVVSAITTADNIVETTREFRRRIREATTRKRPTVESS